MYCHVRPKLRSGTFRFNWLEVKCPGQDTLCPKPRFREVAFALERLGRISMVARVTVRLGHRNAPEEGLPLEILGRGTTPVDNFGGTNTVRVIIFSYSESGTRVCTICDPRESGIPHYIYACVEV